MPRARVKTTYRKVQRPRRRLMAVQEPTGPFMRTPSGELSALGRYIEENRESGIAVHELIEQFQEFDCDHHEKEEIGAHPEFLVFQCQECGLAEKKIRPGVKAA
jgi:hypothetical protein